MSGDSKEALGEWEYDVVEYPLIRCRLWAVLWLSLVSNWQFLRSKLVGSHKLFSQLLDINSQWRQIVSSLKFEASVDKCLESIVQDQELQVGGQWFDFQSHSSRNPPSSTSQSHLAVPTNKISLTQIRQFHSSHFKTMNRNSFTPPCHKENKSPKHNVIKSVSRKDILYTKPTHQRKRDTSASRSASRLINQSDRGQAKSFRRDTKDSSKEPLSLNKKKQSLSTTEVNILISSYENLKVAYSSLLETKRKEDMKEERFESILDDNIKLKKEVEKVKQQNGYYQEQMDRVKKECVRIIEIEGFKIRKLEETLQEKELMLQFLRTQAPSSHSPNVFLQSTPIFKSPDYNSKPFPSNLSLLSLEEISAIEVAERNNFLQSSIHGQNKATITSDDSLVFSKDKSKSNHNHLESVLASPPSTKQEQHPSYHLIEPNCPTFDLKEADENRYNLISNEQKPKKKQLKITTDEKLMMGLENVANDDDIMTHSTKKRIAIPSSKDASQNIACEQVGKKKKMDKIEIQLPKQKRFKQKGAR